MINFASNDYLGLANHPDVIKAARDSMKEFGFGSGASRLIGGGTILHRNLEEKIARFKGAEAALIFNSGYAANTGIIPAIVEEGDVIFSDELNHASIVDGCRLSKAKTVIYKHRDAEHLEELIKKASPIHSDMNHIKERHSRPVSQYGVNSGGNPLKPWIPGQARNDRTHKNHGNVYEEIGTFIVVTDTVFSMDGDIAPLQDIVEICRRYGALLYIDDAHGTGVLGGGKGALAHFNIKPEPWIIQMGTFSKALGSFGALAAGSGDVIEWLINSSRSFIFSTALPACVVAASAKAVEIIEDNPPLIENLWRNRNMLIDALKETGFDTGQSETPIIPLKMKNIENALKLSSHLYEKGIYAPAIRPPTVKEPMIRITITAAHSEEDIRALTEALGQFLE